MAFLLVGNYGVGNLGDEALRAYFEGEFPEIDWAVLTVSPRLKHELSRLPLGIRSLLCTAWWKTVRELYRCDGMVFGGGTLFTDIESVRACFLWGMHACAAFLFRKPVFLAFQGVGPFRTKIGKGIAGFVFRRARFVSVRDSASLARVQEMRVTNVVRTFDPIFALFAERRGSSEGSALVLIPRHNSSDIFLDRSVELSADGRWSKVVILSMQHDDPNERNFCETLAGKVDGMVIQVSTIDELCSAVRDAGCVFTQRYHGALAAIALGKNLEVCVQKEGDKLSTVLRELDGDQNRALFAISQARERLRSALSLVIIH